MPTVMSDDNIAGMTDEELLLLVVREYADPANWEEYEKKMAPGRPSIIRPWAHRDSGFHARRALEIIENRRQSRAA